MGSDHRVWSCTKPEDILTRTYLNLKGDGGARMTSIHPVSPATWRWEGLGGAGVGDRAGTSRGHPGGHGGLWVTGQCWALHQHLRRISLLGPFPELGCHLLQAALSIRAPPDSPREPLCFSVAYTTRGVCLVSVDPFLLPALLPPLLPPGRWSHRWDLNNSTHSHVHSSGIRPTLYTKKTPPSIRIIKEDQELQYRMPAADGRSV